MVDSSALPVDQDYFAGRSYGQSARAKSRRAYLAPLFAYMRANGIIAQFVCERAAAKRGYVLSKSRLYMIRVGECVTPPHFVADVCRELGRSPVEVMGPEWMRLHGPDTARLAR